MIDAKMLVLTDRISHQIGHTADGYLQSEILRPVVEPDLHEASYACIMLRPTQELMDGVHADVLSMANEVSMGKSKNCAPTMLLQAGTLSISQDTLLFVRDKPDEDNRKEQVINLFSPPKMNRQVLRVFKADRPTSILCQRSGRLVVHQTHDGIVYLLVHRPEQVEVNILAGWSVDDEYSVEILGRIMTLYPGQFVDLGIVQSEQPIAVLNGDNESKGIQYVAGLFHREVPQCEEAPIHGPKEAQIDQLLNISERLYATACKHADMEDQPVIESQLDLIAPPQQWYDEELQGYILPILFKGEPHGRFNVSGVYRPLTDHIFQVV